MILNNEVWLLFLFHEYIYKNMYNELIFTLLKKLHFFTKMKNRHLYYSIKKYIYKVQGVKTMKKLFLAMIIISIVVLGFVSCGGKEEAAAPAAPAAAAPAAPAAPVSDGSEDLAIDFQVNLAGADADNYFTWKTNVRYMAAEDTFDAGSGASVAGSTHLFMIALYDVEAKLTMSSGLRGLLLFGVNGADQVASDNLNATKNADGTITIQYVHRGTAYRFVTDKNGVLALPETTSISRKIGSTKNEIEADFSADGTTAGVDFDKVFASGADKNGADADSMYFWDGDLKVSLDGDLLKLSGVLTSVAR